MRFLSFGSVAICILASSLVLAAEPKAPVAAVDPQIQKNLAHLDAGQTAHLSSASRKRNSSASLRKRSYSKLARRMMRKRDQEQQSTGGVGGALSGATDIAAKATAPITGAADGVTVPAQKGVGSVQSAATSPLGLVSGQGVAAVPQQAGQIGSSVDGLAKGGGSQKKQD